MRTSFRFNKHITGKCICVAICILLLAIAMLVGLNYLFQTTPDYVQNGYSFATGSFIDDGAWCWFQNPRAIQYNGTIYTGIVDSNGDVEIWSYDIVNNKTTSFVLHSSLDIDDHAAPALLIRPDGRIIAFYSAHNGASMYYRISSNSENISNWGDEHGFSATSDYTYANPNYLSDENKIHLFYRDTTRDLIGVNSSDNGSTWGIEQKIVDVTNSAYMQITSNGIDAIHFAFTDGLGGTDASENVYYCRYNNSKFYAANGSEIGTMSTLPIEESKLEILYNSSTTGYDCWVWDIALDENEYPVIVYVVFHSVNDHRYRYVRWNGTAWNTYSITDSPGYIDGVGEGYYSGGIALDHDDPDIVYLSKKISGMFEIQRWITSNGGAKWSHINITSNSVNKNIRPITVRNHTSNYNVLWMYGIYTHFTDYDTCILSDAHPLTTHMS